VSSPHPQLQQSDAGVAEHLWTTIAQLALFHQEDNNERINVMQVNSSGLQTEFHGKLNKKK
jgi:hypothetical protein